MFLCVSLDNLAKLSHSHENVWLRQRNPLIFPIFQALNGAKTVKSRQRNSVRRANKPPCTGIGAQLRDGQVLKSSSRDPYLPLCEVSSPPSEVAYPENKKHPTDFSSRTTKDYKQFGPQIESQRLSTCRSRECSTQPVLAVETRAEDRAS